MFPDTILTLGGFAFSRFEIPEAMPFGGDQSLVVHKLVGGQRVVDCMGRDDGPIEWGGLFTGETATERARYLDGLRISGLSYELAWGEFLYEVVVSSFRANYERWYKVPYKISCTVVRDLSGVVDWIAPPGIDDLIDGDFSLCGILGLAIGDSLLSVSLSAVGSAIGAVATFSHAPQSVINAVLVPIVAAQARVSVLIGSQGAIVGGQSTVGGVIPGANILAQVASLNGQATAMAMLPNLYQMQSILGRMSNNLASVNGSQKTVTLAGGNFFGLAAENYNDPTAWTTIARANGLTDPQLSGINTINIPSNTDNSGGVLSA